MSQILVGVFGAGGLAREIAPVVRESHLLKGVNAEIIFVDKKSSGDKINGLKVVDFKTYINLEKEKAAIIAITDSKIREKIFQELKEEKLLIQNLAHTNVVIMDEVELGEGYFLAPHVTLTSNIKIGLSFHANYYSYVAHDCLIGDFVTFAPNVHCNGNVRIGNHAYIGAGAIIKQGTNNKPLEIGEGAIVGMGAVVTKNVAPRTTVIGNPAKLLRK